MIVDKDLSAFGNGYSRNAQELLLRWKYISYDWCYHREKKVIIYIQCLSEHLEDYSWLFPLKWPRGQVGD